MDADEINKIEEIFKHHIGVMSEEIQRKIEHQTGIITDDYKHKLDIVVEGHQMLSDKIDRVETNLGGRLGRVESRLDRVETKLDRVEARLDGVESKLVRVENKVDAVAADLSAHRKTPKHTGLCTG